MDLKTRKRIIIYSSVLLVAVLCVWFGTIMFSCKLKNVNYKIESDSLKENFRIVQISDLHDNSYGKNESEIIERVNEALPDIVVFTGDITESDSDHEKMIVLMETLSEKYPCYYVTGNHEASQSESIKDIVRSSGVKVLDGKTEFLNVGESVIALCGVDSYFDDFETVGGEYITWQDEIDSCLSELEKNEVSFKILLSHRPDLAKDYEKYGFDLVLCGHAHGGQVRIPGILNGLYAPNQGLFPKYAGGYYDLSGTVMIVSRGLDKERAPRVFNRPEIVIVDIGSK